MRNIDKQALRKLAVDAKELAIIKRYTKGIEAQKKFISVMTPATVLALLDELEAPERRSTELTEALRQSVIGYKSCLRMGYDRILDLGGDCDSPEVMIAGNPDIQQAEKLLAAAAGKGE
ncbi:TPA: ead/Ea22-like family protein [Escherichia coli]|uniref:ead/Ea22-like family protein n=1 Tax=Escherichia coli TaxID=562 RepID=UPI001559B9C9|nr:ead/Ea22-like family protein [Escherichia coli]HBE6752516.1 ead/Ea22-like family protein [Escherichia coli]HBE6852903.1 ead/Ea22-like family protein [Escherichia coli]